MSVIQAMAAAQTTAATALAPTAVTAEGTLTWTQMEGTAPADQGSYRMMSQSLVMVRTGGVVHGNIAMFKYSKIVLHGYFKE